MFSMRVFVTMLWLCLVFKPLVSAQGIIAEFSPGFVSNIQPWADNYLIGAISGDSTGIYLYNLNTRQGEVMWVSSKTSIADIDASQNDTLFVLYADGVLSKLTLDFSGQLNESDSKLLPSFGPEDNLAISDDRYFVQHQAAVIESLDYGNSWVATYISDLPGYEYDLSASESFVMQIENAGQEGCCRFLNYRESNAQEWFQISDGWGAFEGTDRKGNVWGLVSAEGVATYDLEANEWTSKVRPRSWHPTGLSLVDETKGVVSTSSGDIWLFDGGEWSLLFTHPEVVREVVATSNTLLFVSTASAIYEYSFVLSSTEERVGHSANKRLTVFPNPSRAGEAIIMSMTDLALDEAIDINIYNMAGSLVVSQFSARGYSSSASAITMKTPERLPAGVYIVSVTIYSRENKRRYSTKLVVSK